VDPNPITAEKENEEAKGPKEEPADKEEVDEPNPGK